MTKPRDLSKLGGGFIQTGTGAVQRTVENKLKDTKTVSDFASTQDAINATPAGGTLYITTSPCSFDGVLINKSIRIVGLGREQGVVTGTITVNNAGLGACFEDISFESPSGTALFSITGRGGIDLKRCRLLAGSGKYAFEWAALEAGTTYTPVAIELIQSYFQSGRLLKTLGTAVRFYDIHAKEGCQIRFTENNAIVINDVGPAAGFLQYEGQLDINSGLTTLGTESRLVLILRNVSIDDGSNLCLQSNLDTTDIADCSIKVNGISRQSIAPSIYKGTGLTTAQTMIQSAVASGTKTFTPYLHGQDLFFITGDVTLTGNIIYALGSGPLYDGQKVEFVFTGTHTLAGRTINIFGLVTVANTTSIGPFAVTAYGYNGSWVARISGARSALTLQQTGTQAALPNTSGASLATLEAEVNAIKSSLRDTGIIAT